MSKDVLRDTRVNDAGSHCWARLDGLSTEESAGWRCVRCGLTTLPFHKQPNWPRECVAGQGENQ